MSRVTILHGTESGNAEMVADDVSAVLEAEGVSTQVAAMDEYDVESLADAGLVVLITSTYGEGELPETAAPFHRDVVDTKPDLSGLRFAAFGLGDSSYDTYNNGIEILRSTVLDLGATQLGQTGRHDAMSGQDPSDVATAWAKEVFEINEFEQLSA